MYRFGAFFVLFVLLIIGPILLLHLDRVRIKNVLIEGNQIVDAKSIREIIDATLHSSYVWVIPKDNRLLFPKRAVKDEIITRFKSIAELNLSFEGAETLIVMIKEHDPAFLWCASEAREICYFMNTQGYIFASSADFSQSVLFTYYGLISGEPISQNFLDAKKFAELNQFVESLKLLKIMPIGLKAREEGDFELLLASGGSVLFSSREDYMTTFENLETIIAEQVRQDPEFLSKLDYVDVRFSSKAFIKTK